TGRSLNKATRVALLRLRPVGLALRGPPTVALPHLTHLFRWLDHWLSRFTRKRFRKLRHIHHDTINTVPRRGMRIRDCEEAQIFRTLVRTRPLSKPDKEALAGSQAINRGQGLIRLCVLPCDISEDLAAKIGDVFTQREFAVDVDIIDDDILRVLILNAL